jgi:hypothetical protein
MAHELNALEFLRRGYNKKQLFYLLEKQAYAFGEAGHLWQGYTYRIPEMWQGRHARLKVIGDKRGATSTKIIHQAPHLLDKASSLCPHFKLIHVVRNPFDSISTSVKKREERQGRQFQEADVKRKIGHFFEKAHTIDTIKKMNKYDILDIHHAQLIKEPQVEIKRLFLFLGLETDPDYIGKCAKIIHTKVHKSRLKSPIWDQALISMVQEKMEQFSFFQPYHFNS